MAGFPAWCICASGICLGFLAAIIATVLVFTLGEYFFYYFVSRARKTSQQSDIKFQLF